MLIMFVVWLTRQDDKLFFLASMFIILNVIYFVKPFRKIYYFILSSFSLLYYFKQGVNAHLKTRLK